MITQTGRNSMTIALTITVLAILPGCSTQAVVDKPAARSSTGAVLRSAPVGEKAAAAALQQVGVPYRYGGATTSGFDCSGLVQFSYHRAGKSVPRTTGQLWSATSTVQRADLKAGDLLFFSIEGKMSHVGLYLGGEQFVHAPSTGRSVTTAKLTSPFYSSAFIRAGRPK
jgi:cell wall-associated NlpC family hydrolase